MKPRWYLYLLTTVVLLLIGGLFTPHALSLGSTANASATPPTGWRWDNVKYATNTPTARICLPMVFNRYQAPEIRQVFQLDELATALESQGDSLYLGVGGRLLVLDASDPLHLVERGRSPVLSQAVSDIAIGGIYAYIAEANGVRVVDIGTATSPVEIAAIATADSVRAVALVGDHLYIASATGLRIVNVATPSAPIETGVLQMPGSAEEVVVNGIVAYVLVRSPQPYGPAGTSMHILDISEPSAPRELAATACNECNTMVTSLHHAYIAKGKQPMLSPIIIGPLPDPIPIPCMHYMDISQPTKPILRYEYACTGEGRDIAVAGERVYLTTVLGSRAKLHVLDTAKQSVLATYALLGPNGLSATVADRLYLTTGTSLYTLVE